MARPSPQPVIASNAYLALVHLYGSNDTVVRDVTSIDHPRTLATVQAPGWDPYPRGRIAFVGPGEVATVTDVADGASQLVVIRYPDQVQPYIEAYGYWLAAFSWSPDRSSLTFMVDTGSNEPWEWHIASAGGDRIVGYGPGVCHCGSGIQDLTGSWLQYSPDGRYISFIQSSGRLEVRTADGASKTRIDLEPSPTDYLTMPVWSGGRLYFRDSKGVEVWDDGVVKPFLPGVAWADPQSSPAGGLIIYSAPDASGLPHVFKVETATGRVTQLAAKGTHEAHFLTDRYVWYRGARPCRATEYCRPFPAGQGYMDTGVTYIFDMQTGAEDVSRISGVADTWPHGK